MDLGLGHSHREHIRCKTFNSLSLLYLSTTSMCHLALVFLNSTLFAKNLICIRMGQFFGKFFNIPEFTSMQMGQACLGLDVLDFFFISGEMKMCLLCGLQSRSIFLRKKILNDILILKDLELLFFLRNSSGKTYGAECNTQHPFNDKGNRFKSLATYFSLEL